MTKKELAILYWDGPMPDDMRIVTNHLMRWINCNTKLLEELRRQNYMSRNREFTPKQVEIIYKFLGEP